MIPQPIFQQKYRLTPEKHEVEILGLQLAFALIFNLVAQYLGNYKRLHSQGLAQI